MALTSEQKSSRLFKKSVGAGETLIGRNFFEESFLGKSTVFLSQIWAQADEIPTPAPIPPLISNGEKKGVVEYHEMLPLTHVPGAKGRSFYSLDLKDCIPFNYHKTYNYKLYTSTGDVIPDGLGDWLVDTEAGLLTFYADNLPPGVSDALPPKISFYKYVGSKGLSGAVIDTLSTDISTEVATRSTADVGLSTRITSEMTSRISTDNLLSTAISSERYSRILSDEGLSNAILNERISTDNLLSTAISSEQNSRISSDVSLSTGLSTTTLIAKGAQQAISFANYSEMVTYLLSDEYVKLNIGQSIYINTIDVPDIWISEQSLTSVDYTYTTDSQLISDVNLGSGKLQIGYTTISFLETQKVNLTDYTTTSALSTAISSEASNRISADLYESSLRLDMDGSGLTYDINNRLQVNVDKYTISIVGDELRTPEIWMEFDSTTSIMDDVTNGPTNIVLEHVPVGYISAYINGIEYMVSSTTSSANGQPFYFDKLLPKQGTRLYFNAVEAGFGLESGVDMIMVKYHYINNNIK